MQPRTRTVEEAVLCLDVVGWVTGPAQDPQERRRGVRSAARQRGWRVMPGLGPPGLPWAARTDLPPERGANSPWGTIGVLPQSYFAMYPPRPVDA